MRRFPIVVLCCLAASLGAAGFQIFASQNPGPQTARPAVRWRYRSVRLIQEAQLDATANEEAEKGWEVLEVVPAVTVTGSSFVLKYTMLFRRAADEDD